MQTVVLKDRSLWSCRVKSPVRISAKRGLLWITQEGDNQDVLLRAGENFRASLHGKLLVQAMMDSEMQWSATDRRMTPLFVEYENAV